MRGYNVCFHSEIRKIIFYSSLIPPLIWSSVQFDIIVIQCFYTFITHLSDQVHGFCFITLLKPINYQIVTGFIL